MILQFGDWKHITLAQIPLSIHNYYVPDAWVDVTRMHENGDQIMIEFDPETAERIGDKIHLWKRTKKGAWGLDKTI